MFRLDYISCVLTISAAILLGQKRWQGWLVAGINSIVVCDIALNTSQLGFIPANVFCVALYAYNILGWRRQIKASRVLGRLPALDDAGAASMHAASTLQKRRPPSVPRPQFESLCCERAEPSFLDGPEPSHRQLLDLHNLLSCAIDPGRDRNR
jgi:hypothetical protein